MLDDEAAKIVINTKGTAGTISDELRAVIRYMDSGLVSNEYTEELDTEVKSVKSDEKVRMSYMLLREAFARERNFGEYRTNVHQIRGNMKRFSIPDMANLLFVSVEACQKVVDVITAHPDWDDERIAEEIDWDRQ